MIIYSIVLISYIVLASRLGSVWLRFNWGMIVYLLVLYKIISGGIDILKSADQKERIGHHKVNRSIIYITHGFTNFFDAQTPSGREDEELDFM